MKNLHTKVDENYNDHNNKFSHLTSSFEALENQFSSMTSTSKHPMGYLPGKSEQDSKEYCNDFHSIDIYGIELSDHEKEVDEIQRILYGIETVTKVKHIF